MGINNITGPPVEGTNFFGRQKLIEHAWEQIQIGNHLVFAAPRRVGKTSFGKKLIRRADARAWQSLEINLETVKSEEDFVRTLIQILESKTWFRKFLKKSGRKIDGLLEKIKPAIGYDGFEVKLEWKKHQQDVFEELKQLLNHEEDTLIMIDELTVLLHNFIVQDEEHGLFRAESFLNWLRNLRQVTGTKIRWIFCSSVGIANFCNLHGLSYTLNDVRDFEIGAYEYDVASDLLHQLAKTDKLEFPEGIIPYILDEKITWHLPYFLQLVYSNINASHKLEGIPITKAAVDKAFLQLCNQNNLDTWDERLKQYGPLEKTARRILTHTCSLKNGTTRKKLLEIIYDLHQEDIDETELALSRVLKMLINDGYFMKTDEGLYTFRSSVIKWYWYYKFVA